MGRAEPSEGQILELRIDGVGAHGEGVGHLGGRAVFVPLTAPGELVRARVVHAGRRRVVAELVALVEPSADRVEPDCPVYGRCGGCQLMHLSYPAQLAWKRIVLTDALRSLAGLEWPAPVPIQASDPQLGYRNRGQYPVARQADRVVTGFFAPRSHRVVPVERCRIHHPELDAAVVAVRDWAGRKRVPIYDERRRQGWLRHVVVRRSHASGRSLVTLVGAGARAGDCGDLVRLLRRRVPGVAGLVANSNSRATNVILGPTNRLLWGQPSIEERLLGLDFGLSTGSFFQVNTPQAAALFSMVREFCGPVRGPVVDAYCGVGVLAQVLAAAGHEVIGIELAEAALADAQRAAERNGLAVRFEPGRVEQVLPRLVAAGRRVAAVVLDPPRKGCDPAVLQAIAASSCERVAYISCHPGSLARDLSRLAELGYRPARIEAVDMFPQTAHVETLVGLVRR